MFGGGIDAVKAEKERAMLRCRRLRRAAALSRCLFEALAALSLLSWSSARLPSALSLLTALRHLPTLLLHPLSAFLLGNAIIVALVAKSSDAAAGAAPSPPSDSPGKPPSSAVRGEDRNNLDVSPCLQRRRGEPHETHVVYEDKAVCPQSATTESAAGPQQGMPEGCGFQRTRSVDAGPSAKRSAEENLLRRTLSETGVVTAQKAVVKWWDEVEEEQFDDSEEFRQKIEAFIARQMRFIEKEEKSLLIASKAASVADHRR